MPKTLVAGSGPTGDRQCLRILQKCCSHPWLRPSSTANQDTTNQSCWHSPCPGGEDDEPGNLSVSETEVKAISLTTWMTYKAIEEVKTATVVDLCWTPCARHYARYLISISSPDPPTVLSGRYGHCPHLICKTTEVKRSITVPKIT